MTRFSPAARLPERAADLTLVVDILGHADVRTTARYTRSTIAARRCRASSLCGACYEVCPVKIDIPSVLLHLRGRVVREYKSRRSPEALAMETVGRVFASQRRYEQAQKLARLGHGPIVAAALPGWSAMRGLPEVPEQTFREWWRSRPPRRNGDGSAL